MSISSYLVAILSGVIIYLVMIIDCKYIDPNDRPISPKIPLFVTLLVWTICMFYKTDSITQIPVSQQPMLMGGFYSK